MEALGSSERSEIISRLALLIAHLLKWQYQPERRTYIWDSTKKNRSWDGTIREQRMMIKIHLKNNPGLNGRMREFFAYAYRIAKSQVENETLIDKKIFPDECPYTFEQIKDDTFYPEFTTKNQI